VSVAQTLFAPPATVAELGRARAVALLIGSYDGSGNYGDLAQLDAALSLLQKFEPALLVLPLLERSRLADHRALVGEFLHPPTRALFFDPGEGHEDELQPVAAPADLAFAACYLYGGGYLNASWGGRKLAMLRAAEELLGAGGATEVCRMSSGLQADADWVAALSEADAESLGGYEPLGARDPSSREALAALGGGAEARETGDDAVGLLRRLIDGPVAEPADRASIYVHVAEHPWATERPQAIADFYADLLAEVARRADQPVVARPLIAYHDRWVSEQQAVERLAEACAKRGVELSRPQVLRPAGLPGELSRMRRATLTVSSSYHVALTSLMLGVPTVLLGDNPYYEQKAAGLIETFGLPDGFTPTSHTDPASLADEIAAVVFDDARLADLRSRLSAAGGRLSGTRAAVEAELLAVLGSAAVASLSDRLGEAGERLRERSAEPAELLARLAMLEPDDGVEPEVAPQQSNHAAERMLAEVLGSRSWRMTSPLRRAGARLRRR
jgi:polysaccharide pyruvyl transferase WcaK-like protein